VVDAVGAVFREELRHGIVDLARGFQVEPMGFSSTTRVFSARPTLARFSQIAPYTAAGVAK
jgi:hypothetical protein